MKTIFSIMIVALLFGCKKYPDDSKRYFFKSPLKRIDQGLWIVDKLTIDGEDSTSRTYKSYLQTPALNYMFKDVRIRFKTSNHAVLSGYRAVTVTPVGVTATQSAAWNFTNGKDQLRFFFDNSANYTNSFQLNNKSQVWDILTLTEDKMEIITTESIRKIKLSLRPA